MALRNDPFGLGLGWAAGSLAGGVPVETLSVSVAASADDGREVVSTGAVNFTDTSINIGADARCLFRFEVPTLPQGAEIVEATIIFTSTLNTADVLTLTIFGEDADAAAQITTATGNITSRVQTTSFLDWSAPAWDQFERGPNTTTPDLSAIVQEIVDRVGFAGVLAFTLERTTGTGGRVPAAFDHATLQEAVLTVRVTT